MDQTLIDLTKKLFEQEKNSFLLVLTNDCDKLPVQTIFSADILIELEDGTSGVIKKNRVDCNCGQVTL